MSKREWINVGHEWDFVVDGKTVAYIILIRGINYDSVYRMRWRGPQNWFIVYDFDNITDAKDFVEHNA